MGPRRRAYDAFEGPHSTDRALAELASRQHGVVSQAQLVDLGLTRDSIRRRVEGRRLHRLHDGVFAVGHLGLTPSSRHLAAVLACGPGSLLSHRSSGVAWRLLRSSSTIEVTAPRGRKPREGIIVHRSRLIHPDDRAVVDGIPVTSVARTLVDLADVLPERRLADAVNEAEVLRMFDLAALTAVLDRLPGRRGRHRLRRVLAAYTEDAHFTRSRAERRFLGLCGRQGLPVPQTNLWIESHEIDAYWPDAKLAVELDGGAYHRTRRAFHEDRRRDRRLAAVGIHVVRVAWADLEAEAALARELRAIRDRRLAA